MAREGGKEKEEREEDRERVDSGGGQASGSITSLSLL